MRRAAPVRIAAARNAALPLALALAGSIAGATVVVSHESENPPVDPDSPIWRHTHAICLSIFAAGAGDPDAACTCMTPILMGRLTDEARAKLAENPDELPFGAPLFRDATDEERAAQRACLE